MTLEEKRAIISQNKDPTVAAITSVIDTHYNLLAPVTTDKQELIEDSFKDKRSLNFARGLKTDV
jgi:hypothetical protein